MINYIKKIKLKKLKEHIKKLDAQGLYSVCSSKYFMKKFNDTEDVGELLDLYDYAIECDNKCSVIRGTGKKIESLIDNKDITVAIYENDSYILQSELVRNGINDGILNVQNINFSYFDKPFLTNTLVFPDNIIDTMYLLKDSLKGSFLLTFPKKLVKEDGDYSISNYSDIFTVNNENTYIKPVFIDSYISFNQNLMNIINKKDLEKNLVNKIKPTI